MTAKHEQLSRAVLEQRILARTKEIGSLGVSLAGSVNVIYRRCGRKGCACASDDAKRHPARLLTYKEKGKTKSTYVPVDMHEEVALWTRNRRRIKELLAEIDEMAEQIIRRHVETSRAVRRNRSPQKRTRPNSSASS